MLNEAQLEAAQDVLEWPEGSIHLWRWANRAGKTTGLILLELYLVWKKWRYTNADAEGWLGYRYKVLHAAPLGRLMGKAWEIADAMIEGSAIIQRSPITHRQRPGIFVKAPWFKATSMTSKDGTSQLLVLCLNGGQVDFLQTESGAGRMESDAWWFLAWDEFGEHQPVENVPYLFDSTFLPRSSDFMAPVVMASTEKEKNAAVYMELEDLAERSPKDWNIKEFGRSVNFSQTQESMDRQVRLSSDSATSHRSVYGGAAEGGAGSLLPAFTVRRAFDPDLPISRTLEDLPPAPFGKTWKLIQSFDHAAKGDRNVVGTVAVPWPIRDREELIRTPAQALDLVELKGSRTLTGDEMIGFAVAQYQKHGSRSLWFTDATGEAGIMVHRGLRAKGVPSRDFNFTARQSPTDRRTKKSYGRTGMQRLFALGLPIDEDTGAIILAPGVSLDEMDFGGIRIPHPDPGVGPTWRRLQRQLLMLRADDANQQQDHAMVFLMIAAALYPYLERNRQSRPVSFSIHQPRETLRRGLARVR